MILSFGINLTDVEKAHKFDQECLFCEPFCGKILKKMQSEKKVQFGDLFSLIIC